MSSDEVRDISFQLVVLTTPLLKMPSLLRRSGTFGHTILQRRAFFPSTPRHWLVTTLSSSTWTAVCTDPGSELENKFCDTPDARLVTLLFDHWELAIGWCDAEDIFAWQTLARCPIAAETAFCSHMLTARRHVIFATPVTDCILQRYLQLVCLERVRCTWSHLLYFASVLRHFHDQHSL